MRRKARIAVTASLVLACASSSACASGFFSFLSSRPAFGGDPSLSLLQSGSRTAIYDVSAGRVYLPSGERIEAHSGIGAYRDNPQYSHVKMRGPTPPSTYSLQLRRQRFHGVEAIRLLPENGQNPLGRDGLLAHSYMLKAPGDSNGCIVFPEYDRFLKAFKSGSITRIAVVPSLSNSDVLVAKANTAPAKVLQRGTVAVAQAGGRSETRAADPRLNQALAALSAPADAFAPAVRSVAALDLDAMQGAVQTASLSVPMPVPAPARPSDITSAWNTGAQPAAPAVPLPPVPDASMRQAPHEAPQVLAALPPTPPTRPVLQPGRPVAASVASLDQPLADMPRQFLGQDGSFGQRFGRALGYAAAEPAIAAPPVTAPRVEFVAARFDQIDFGSLASPAAAAHDAAQTELYAPDLSAAPGLITVAMRLGPQRVARLHTAGFAGVQTASVD